MTTIAMIVIALAALAGLIIFGCLSAYFFNRQLPFMGYLNVALSSICLIVGVFFWVSSANSSNENKIDNCQNNYGGQIYGTVCVVGENVKIIDKF